MKNALKLGIIAIIVIIGFSMTACGDGGGGDDHAAPVIYVAGTYYDGSSEKACYWRDGIPIDLHPTSLQEKPPFA